MRAKEFIVEYAVVSKPDYTKVSGQCPDCYGSGNVDIKGTTQTCPTCKGVGSKTAEAEPQSNYASDMDNQMNQPDNLWAAGKF